MLLKKFLLKFQDGAILVEEVKELLHKISKLIEGGKRSSSISRKCS